MTSPGDHLKPKVILIESWFGNEGVGSKEQERSATDMVCERPKIRAAESWWGCSDSDSGSDSGLLIDSDSGSDSDS